MKNTCFSVYAPGGQALSPSFAMQSPPSNGAPGLGTQTRPTLQPWPAGGAGHARPSRVHRGGGASICTGFGAQLPPVAPSGSAETDTTHGCASRLASHRSSAGSQAAPPPNTPSGPAHSSGIQPGMGFRSQAQTQGESHGASLTLISIFSSASHACPSAGPHEHVQLAGGADRPRLPMNGSPAANASGQPGSLAGSPSNSAKVPLQPSGTAVVHTKSPHAGSAQSTSPSPSSSAPFEQSSAPASPPAPALPEGSGSSKV
ncbi:hypothetical protein SCE1572_18860 [Sorangium cellulosum So0157-2]|uniref:Uncharacterized protein n=1 Tax=Sorangium cellulosum So0157-2 TaxID=1254432 RepID=S4XVK6_SORCE|nr:hypothetical protein SCE1572_18860 [Sorangium cellulosum So0157-2]